MSWSNALVERLWVGLPVILAARAPAAGNALTDGLHLTRWPTLAALAPPIAVVVGLGVGAAAGESVTSNMWFLSALMLVGIHSACLGTWAWLGFATGDLLLSDAPLRYSLTLVERWVGVPLSTLSHWLLVAVVTVIVPLSVLTFRIELRKTPWPERLGDSGERIAVGAFAVALSWLWVTAMPLLVRPIFRLVGDDPSVETIAGVQQRWWILVTVALAGWVTRLIVERRSLGEPYYATLRKVASGFARIPPRAAVPRRTSRVLIMLALTLLLAGLIESWLWVPPVMAALYAILTARDRMSRLESLTAIPLVYRTMGGAVIAFVLLRVALSVVASGGRVTQESFAVPLIATLSAMALVAFITAPAAVPAPAQHTE